MHTCFYTTPRREIKMLLIGFGSLMGGSGLQVMFNKKRPLYPKDIGGFAVVMGAVLVVVGLGSPAILW